MSRSPTVPGLTFCLPRRFCGCRAHGALSPVADPTCSSASFTNGSCYLADARDENGDPIGEALLHPTVTSTLLQSITTRVPRSVPPNTRVYASENELFADDARYLARLGATAILSPARPGGHFHAWPLWDIPEANATLRAACLCCISLAWLMPMRSSALSIMLVRRSASTFVLTSL